MFSSLLASKDRLYHWMHMDKTYAEFNRLGGRVEKKISFGLGSIKLDTLRSYVGKSIPQYLWSCLGRDSFGSLEA